MSTRVLHVIHGLGRGGLENGVVNLLNGLPSDIEQAVVCMDTLGEMAQRVDKAVPIWVIGRGRHDLGAIWRLARRMRAFKPDVVHARNWNCWPDAVLAHRLAGRPGRLLWSFHGFPDGQEQMPWARRVGSRLLAAMTDELIAVCADAGQRYARVAGLDEGRFKVLYNGVDTRRFVQVDEAQRRALRQRFGMVEGRLEIVTVASLTAVKSHKTLVQAVALLRQAWEGKVAFRFVGEGPLRADLEHQVAELGLQKMIALPGASDEVPALLAGADGFVLPSRLEGMSNAIIEAMAAGLPVVAAAVGGNVELVEDGVCGCLCRPEDADSMAKALFEAFDDEGHRLAMGAQARESVMARFSMQAMMARYGDCYRGEA